MRKGFFLQALLYSIIISFIANSFLLTTQLPQILLLTVPLFLFIVVFACFLSKTNDKQVRFCYHGTLLLCAFCASLIVSCIYQIPLAFQIPAVGYIPFIGSILLCLVINFIVFWVGIICVYLTSTQLGIKIRFAGVICGSIPIANLVVLFIIIKTTAEECIIERTKEEINKLRQAEKICATKYPILLVHGVFFRDTKFFNYWGRIPKELETNGATIFYGNQRSAASIADCAGELKERIEKILAETGAQKVNIIAHSKGGLDSRYAIAKLGIGDYVASLTTINTPHQGCLFADYLLTNIPVKIKNNVADTYNSALKNLGESNADFLSAVNDLTDAACRKLNSELTMPDGIYCQSVGTILAKATGGTFPLNFSYHLVKYFDGENDGLVSEKSFRWGENYILLRPTGRRGISHADIIDLNRENVEGFDVREFYVGLVHNLKNRGL